MLRGIRKAHEGGMKLMNGPKAGIVRRRCFFLWLAVLAIALHPAAAFAAGQKQPAIQQVCGQDLEVVWEKAVVPESRNSRVFFKVHPAGKHRVSRETLAFRERPCGCGESNISFIISSVGTNYSRIPEAYIPLITFIDAPLPNTERYKEEVENVRTILEKMEQRREAYYRERLRAEQGDKTIKESGYRRKH
jgi:hypothetical protein